MSDAERFQRLAELFEAARTLPGDARTAFLGAECGGDSALVEQVQRLLARHESDDGPLAEPIASAGARFLAAGPAAVAVPESIGDYRVLGLIGAGGMGAVYLAEQPDPRRRVALKVIRPGIASDDTLRRLRFEASLLGRLQHPGIARIYEAGTYFDGVGDRPFFAMEYVDGVSLLDYSTTRDLDTAARVDLLALVCDAVQHAHQQGVIHRDLKPANIVVDASGQPKVLDFGVARSTESGRNSQVTQAGALLGTIGYMSPEQIESGPDAVDTRTDIHALGVLLYELLAGRMPYNLSDTTMVTALRRMREDLPTPLGRVAPALRGDLETICAKAIEKDKARRYQAASDLRDDLRRFLRNEPITARPASTVYQLRKLARRNRPLVTAVGLTLVALIASLIAMSSAAYHIARERDDAIAAMNDATAATNFLAEVLTTLDPRQRATPEVSLRAFLDDVAERLDGGALADRARVEAAIRRTIGNAYRELGALDEAGRHLERSLALYRGTEAGTRGQVAAGQSSLGVLRLRRGELGPAEAVLHEAIATFEALPGPDARAGLAEALQTLATVRLEQRRLTDAEAHLRRGLDLLADDPERPSELRTRMLISLAVVLRASDRIDEARDTYERILAMQRRQRPEPGLDVATTLGNLAVLHMYAEDPDAAEPLVHEALRIRKAFLPPDHRGLASTYNCLGGLHSMRFEWAAAEEMYREAIRIRIAAGGADHYSLATPYVNLGVAQRESGRLAESIRSLERAVEIRRAALGPGHVQLVSPLSQLARSHIVAGDAEASLAAASEVRAIIAGGAAADPEQALLVDAILGRALALAGRFDEAEEKLLAAHDGLVGRSPPPDRLIDLTRDWLVEVYRAWDVAVPGGGHDAAAQEWAALRANAP